MALLLVSAGQQWELLGPPCSCHSKGAGFPATWGLESTGELSQFSLGVKLRKKEKGGISISHTVPMTKLDDDLVKAICGEYKISNADICFRCDASADDLIDVIEGNRLYVPCIYVLRHGPMFSRCVKSDTASSWDAEA